MQPIPSFGKLQFCWKRSFLSWCILGALHELGKFLLWTGSTMEVQLDQLSYIWEVCTRTNIACCKVASSLQLQCYCHESHTRCNKLISILCPSLTPLIPLHNTLQYTFTVHHQHSANGGSSVLQKQSTERICQPVVDLAVVATSPAIF